MNRQDRAGSDTPLKRLLVFSVLLYGFFLIPTVLLVASTGFDDARISRWITGAWQATFWRIPTLSSVGSRVVLDLLEISVLLGLTALFIQGTLFLHRPPLDERGKQGSRRLLLTVVSWTLICGGVLVAVIPFHSSDLYGYLNRGFQQSLHYQSNPYLTPIVELPGWQQNPLFHPHWIYNPCPYGFFFARWVAGLTGLAGPFFVKAFLILKVVNLILLLGATLLLYRLSVILKHSRPELCAFLFGANPLVLLHAMGNGHNDILLAFLLLLSLWCLFHPRWIWAALPCLLLSMLTKYASLLAAPFMLLYLLKKHYFKSVGVGLLLSVILVVLLAAPYLTSGEPWPWAAMLDNAGKPQHSLIDMLARLVYYPVKWLHGPAETWMGIVLRVLKPVFWLSYILFFGWRLYRFFRITLLTPMDLLMEIGLSMAVMIALVSAKFHPWYAVMFLPVLLLLPEYSRLRRFGILFSLFQIIGFTVFQNLPVFGVIVLTGLPLYLAFKKSDCKN